ncbi:MAG: TVP38/TMEM64 family protein [Sinimarinibacterium flocculans]|uniref:TVP38/TMEM64 family protein n=1 Tax=Sinimarinibacterium flocculans TaxID=985250 RepID=UPI003C597624
MAARHRRVIVLATLCLVVGLVAAAWKWTALGDWIEPERIAGWIGAIRHSPFAPLILLGAYLGASALMLPNTALNAATILGLGTAVGLPSALLGSMAAALCYYALGRRYGTRPLRKLAPDQVDRLRAAMGRNSTLKVASIRMLPIAPFVVVNVVAGSAGVRFRPFAAGTLLGLLPGNLMMTAFGHQLRALLREPRLLHGAVLLVILTAAAAAGWWLHRRASGA